MRIKYDINKILHFGVPKEVKTKNGQQTMAFAKPNAFMWRIYRSHKETLKSMGISACKVGTEWFFVYFKTLMVNEDEIQQSLAIDSDVELVKPCGLDYLPFQKAGIAYGMKHPNFLLGDEMGLGKTIQAIGILNNVSFKKAIIICPKVLLGNWQKELKKWLVKPLSVCTINSKYQEADIQILNYEAVNKFKDQLLKQTYDYVILDEAHYIKNHKTQRAKNAKMLHGKIGNIRITGTPFENRPVELWNLINDLDRKRFGNYMQYTKRYCNGHYSPFGYECKGASHIDELYNLLRSSIMLRRKKEDVLHDLPSKQRQIIYLTTSKEQLRLINEEMDLNINYDDLFKDPKFTELMRIKHEIALSKVKQVVEYIQTIYEKEPDKKLVLACVHRDVEENLMDALKKYKPLLINGLTKDTDRQKYVEQFQNNQENKIMIISMKAAGIGITLTASDTMLFVEENYVPGIMCQTEDRIHRIGQENSVTIQHLILDMSMEETILEKVFQKQSVIDKALDGSKRLNQENKQTKEKGLFLEVEVSDKEYAEYLELFEKQTLSKEQVLLIHKTLKFLAHPDVKKGCIGFNRNDKEKCLQLASQTVITQKQAIGIKPTLRKYWRQLPENTNKMLWGK